MLSVNLAQDQVEEHLKSNGMLDQGNHPIHIACINSPLNTTLSGPEEAIDKLKEDLDKRSISNVKLKTGVYHSPAMRVIMVK